MSRIYIGGGGLALFVGAMVGVAAGKGSWFLPIVGLPCFPQNQPIPFDLIERITKLRRKQNMA